MVFNSKASLTSDRPIYDEFYDGYRLFVGDLSERVANTDVFREFSRFGDLIDVWVARNPPGFGFVVFHNKIDCQRCQRKLNGRTIFDRPLRIEFAVPTSIRDDGRAPASYQAYIVKLRERGIEPRFQAKGRSSMRRYRKSPSPIPTSSKRRRISNESYHSSRPSHRDHHQHQRRDESQRGHGDERKHQRRRLDSDRYFESAANDGADAEGQRLDKHRYYCRRHERYSSDGKCRKCRDSKSDEASRRLNRSPNIVLEGGRSRSPNSSDSDSFQGSA